MITSLYNVYEGFFCNCATIPIDRYDKFNRCRGKGLKGVISLATRPYHSFHPLFHLPANVLIPPRNCFITLGFESFQRDTWPKKKVAIIWKAWVFRIDKLSVFLPNCHVSPCYAVVQKSGTLFCEQMSNGKVPFWPFMDIFTGVTHFYPVVRAFLRKVKDVHFVKQARWPFSCGQVCIVLTLVR